MKCLEEDDVWFAVFLFTFVVDNFWFFFIYKEIVLLFYIMSFLKLVFECNWYLFPLIRASETYTSYFITGGPHYTSIKEANHSLCKAYIWQSPPLRQTRNWSQLRPTHASAGQINTSILHSTFVFMLLPLQRMFFCFAHHKWQSRGDFSVVREDWTDQ